MFGKLANGINWMKDAFCFDDYWSRLLRSGTLGGVHINDARRDYLSIEQSRSPLSFF